MTSLFGHFLPKNDQMTQNNYLYSNKQNVPVFWESYLSFSNIHLLSNCQYPASVWSGRGHCITTTRLGQVLVPGQHRSYFRTPDRHLTKLRLWRPFKRGIIELNNAILFSPAGCCHWSEAVQAGSLVQCVLAVMLRPGDDRMFVFTNKYTTGDQEPLGTASREWK